MKAIVSRDGVNRCGACPQIMVPRYDEPDHAFKKRKYCSHACQKLGAAWLKLVKRF